MRKGHWSYGFGLKIADFHVCDAAASWLASAQQPALTLSLWHIGQIGKSSPIDRETASHLPKQLGQSSREVLSVE
jgi:hypothetical protein